MASDSKRAQILADLAPALMEGETVLLWSTGIARVKRFGSGTERRRTLFVTDHRVGIFTKKMGGHDLLDFAYGLLTSIQYKKGIGFGEITLLASGDSTRFHQMPKAGVEEIAQTIRQRMALAHQGGLQTLPPPPPPPPPPPSVSVADEILPAPVHRSNDGRAVILRAPWDIPDHAHRGVEARARRSAPMDSRRALGVLRRGQALGMGSRLQK